MSFSPKGRLPDGKVLFQDGNGNTLAATLESVLHIADQGTEVDSRYTAGPSKQQAQEAVKVLGLQHS